MQQFITFLAEIEFYVYLVLGLLAVIFIRRVIISLNAYKGAVFGLEKELAQRKVVKSITTFFMIILLIIAEFVVVTFLKPELPQVPSFASPSPQTTPTSDTTETPSLQVTGTPTATPYPQAEVEGYPSNCQQGVLEFTYPRQDETVQGVVELIGTVNTPNFGSFKYEFSTTGPVNWITVAAGSELRTEEPLGFWYTTSLDPGTYLLRLVALDNQGQETMACIIKVNVTPVE